MAPGLFERLESSIFPSLNTLMIGGNNFSEPLLANNWGRMFRSISRYPIQPYIVTNGLLLDEKKLRTIEEKNSMVFISCEGATDETYRAFRGIDFQKVKQNIRSAIKLRQEMRSASQFRFNFTMMRTNLHEVPLLIQTAAELGMDGVNLMHFIPFGEKQRFLSLYYHQNETNHVLDEARELAQKYVTDLSSPDNFPTPCFPGPGQDESSGKREGACTCQHPWTSISVNEEGLVSPCCVTSVVMGDLRTRSFDEIWEGSKYQRLRRRVNSPHPPLYCRSCQIRGEKDMFNSSYNDPAIIFSVIGPERHVGTELFLIRQMQSLLTKTKVGSRIADIGLRIYRRLP